MSDESKLRPRGIARQSSLSGTVSTTTGQKSSALPPTTRTSTTTPGKPDRPAARSASTLAPLSTEQLRARPYHPYHERYPRRRRSGVAQPLPFVHTLPHPVAAWLTSLLALLYALGATVQSLPGIAPTPQRKRIYPQRSAEWQPSPTLTIIVAVVSICILALNGIAETTIWRTPPAYHLPQVRNERTWPQTATSTGVLGALQQIIGVGRAAFSSWPGSKPLPTTAQQSSEYSARSAGDHDLRGAPSLTADQIDRILASYGSPATGTGEVWLRLGQKYEIDPAYAVAFFIHESSAGTNLRWAGMKPGGATTHNVGNIICAGYPRCYGRFRDYTSWEEGIEDWYRLIAVEYIQGRGTVTVAQIVPIYAPAFENDVQGYINAVERLVDTWRSNGVPR